MDFARTIPLPQLREATKMQITRVLEAWTHALERHSGARGFLFGNFSIADCMYAPVVSRFRTYDVTVPKIVQAYCNRISELPAMQDWGKASQREVDSGLA